ncbi:DEKNAAC102389 [Brettanomyces naardenensis]|uniref:Exosome complex protein n=1 Tax=Brettanomyces naardenensis TaxID=13370 RepID=A0A448YKA5_BRENA|nr:DEKNAAC102389 [Brettanomyces naardenensis]
MEDPDSVKKILESTQAEIGSLQKTLNETILRKDLNELLISLGDDADGAQSELAKCKLLNSYAYVIASLYFSYLKAAGMNKHNEHPIMQELGRVKSYIGRVQTAEQRQSKQQELSEADREAAKRFVESEFGAKEPAISSVHFEGTHKRFRVEGKEDEADDDISVKADIPKIGAALKTQRKTRKTAKSNRKQRTRGRVTKK